MCIFDLPTALTGKKTDPGRDKGMREWAMDDDIFCNTRWQ
jgi:hypothetical protein